MKELKLWNGRGYICMKFKDPLWANITKRTCPDVAIAAYSRADAVRLIKEYLGRDERGVDSEIRDYFNEGWGNSMGGITPERGIWVEFSPVGKPTKVI